MDLQTIKSHYGAKWAWARTGALILFVVTGILLVASLSTARSQQPSRAFAGPGVIELNPFATAG
ncbi:MAG: hypothetical protein ABI457_02300 [Hyphomicrobium sp.]